MESANNEDWNMWQMASGKTTLAEHLKNHHGFEIISMAGEVKRVGRELFGMTKKDRPLLQKIGMKMREIRESVWLDAVINQSQNYEIVVCDDVRFINEAKNLKDFLLLDDHSNYLIATVLIN